MDDCDRDMNFNITDNSPATLSKKLRLSSQNSPKLFQSKQMTKQFQNSKPPNLNHNFNNKEVRQQNTPDDSYNNSQDISKSNSRIEARKNIESGFKLQMMGNVSTFRLTKSPPTQLSPKISSHLEPVLSKRKNKVKNELIIC